MPATLCSEHGWKRRPIAPVFYAPTDIQPGDLRQELEARLRASRHLIVICSPHSAKAKWVGWEIAYFHSLGRTENIHFFIVDGEPHSQDHERECFNPIIEELGIPEQLGANIHERVSRWPWVNRERAVHPWDNSRRSGVRSNHRRVASQPACGCDCTATRGIDT